MGFNYDLQMYREQKKNWTNSRLDFVERKMGSKTNSRLGLMNSRLAFCREKRWGSIMIYKCIENRNKIGQIVDQTLQRKKWGVRPIVDQD